MRTLCNWRWTPLVVLLLASGCSRSPTVGTPFGGQPIGTQPGLASSLPPFASGPLAVLPRTTPAVTATELEAWRNGEQEEAAGN